MLKINKILQIPRSPFKQNVDMLILKEIETLVHFRVSHINYKEIIPCKGMRRFKIAEVYGMQDKS